MQNVAEHENAIVGGSWLGLEEVVRLCANATLLASYRNITFDIGLRQGDYLGQILNYETAIR